MNKLFFVFSIIDLVKNDTVYYIICAVLSLAILLGIYMMSKVENSVAGNRLNAIALGIGVVVTLLKYDALPLWIIYVGLALGTIIGLILAYRVKMIQMPQMVALLNGVGGGASFLVGIFAVYGIGAEIDAFSKATSLLAVSVGIITLLGSLVAAGKLHKVLTQKSVVIKFHQQITSLSIVLAIVSIVIGSFTNILTPTVALIATTAFSSIFGIMFTIRVGGADMPITISLLNSFSGVAGAIAGLAIGDAFLVAVGGIVGSSGLLLTQIMCRAMNRSLLDILLGKTTASSKVVKKVETKKEPIVEKKGSYIDLLKEAKEIIIVPGYGMAIAQAQHLVKNLADKLTANGAHIKYAIHPVAGRMPGHMNVLLAEADVDYDDLYEMEEINKEFKNVDLTIVVGANDVLNPAAREAEDTPIYGMPILNVDESKNVIIFNYDTAPGYAGVDNPLYNREDVHLVLGNAFDTITKLLNNFEPSTPTTKEINTEEEYIKLLKEAKEIIIVPGYGMAIAQAQHLVKNLADKLTANGAHIKYAIHPVAGRMPGHMNVLLAEADVDYDDLYEMEEINKEFKNVDLTIVVGANDVLNPAAREAEDTPIYGMPILNVDESKNVIIFNYDTAPGYAGVDNPLYNREDVHLVLGNAFDTISKLLEKL